VKLEELAMTVAMPVWAGGISPVFDAARHLMVVEVEHGKEAHREEVLLPEQSVLHRASRMVDLGVDVLICGGISRGQSELLRAYKVKVLPWVAGKPDQILVDYLAGELSDRQHTMVGH